MYSCTARMEEPVVITEVHHQSYDTIVFENLHNYFVADTIPNTNLRAFEQRGMHKLMDYANLVEMITNKDVRKRFRKQSAKMAQQLFVSEDVFIEELGSNNSNKKTVKAKKHFKKLARAKKHLKLDFSELQIVDHLKLVDDNLLMGSIAFKQDALEIEGDSIISTDVTYKQAEIIVQMVEKQFGTETEIIWTVRIGNIVIVDLLVGKYMGHAAI